MVLHARVRGNVSNVIPRIRQEVWKLDPTLPLFDVHTLEEEMNAALVQQRLISILSTLFGGLALILACVGLYGLLAFAVVQRIGEMGVRIALGASRTSVVWLVMREALVLVIVGIGVGIPAALGVARLAASQIAGLLYRLKPTDPYTIAAASLVLIVVAAFAAYLPARRASRVDPLIALRSE
jgi:ABC-type antimicrobial peptide transport system permease subunit